MSDGPTENLDIGEPALDERLARLVGQTLDGRYRVDALAGTGGMGAVFRAHHVGLEQDVALKVLHPRAGHDGSASARFKREAKSASRLDHPNCVRVTDFGELDDGTMFLVMQLLEGHELKDDLGSPWEIERAIGVGIQILDGLAHAHANKVVHRDLKPENIFVTSDHRGETQIKLVDFGIAKVMGGGSEHDLTRTGVVFGTPKYMSPEQATGGKVDARSDLYTVGLILFEMLTGKPPFDSDEAAVLLRMHILAETPSLPPTLPKDLRLVVHRLLEKSRKDRFQSAEKALEALEAARASGPSPGPPAVATAPGDTLLFGSNTSMRAHVAQPSGAVWSRSQPAPGQAGPGETLASGSLPLTSASTSASASQVPALSLDQAGPTRRGTSDANPAVALWLVGSTALVLVSFAAFGWAVWTGQSVARAIQPPVGVWAVAGTQTDPDGGETAGEDGEVAETGEAGDAGETGENDDADDAGDPDKGDKKKKKKKKAKKKPKKKKKK